ncbi:hypothetical protein HU746_22505 [Pseudomonas lurida]|uniref:hypothetical protein n=1 Tax=Pseudomonas lurida TaxID=244566 RepID=UPI000BF8D112|nr:hypothetical protein [Pseudomonas lurida]MBC3247417.1 hypothetical protein [Pseudomonas lurida]MCF5026569.1 hypothetical protein [Pseudomonas lurida]MCF5309766.1 hypothetical protein [Pseudomonas lurida]MCF5327441.1 hypothetical protein [Pseudomonas lurida]PFG25948.1 hypothetical protein ATH90_4846 [Pseudomonas lurida]
MQSSPTQAPSATGERVASFRHGKGFLIFSVVFGVVLLALAGFVLYLGTILPSGNDGPVNLQTSRGMALNFANPHTLIYATSALLAVLALGVFAAYAWHKKLRAPRYNVFEFGIERIINEQREYTAFADIEDLYLFGSGQTVMTGMITNLAYRRNASEPFHRVTESLKGFYEFQQLVRELHVRARMPAVIATLEMGAAVTFNCISSGQVWGKRVSGNFLKITTTPILVSRAFLEYQGRNVPMSSLRTVDLNAWTEKVVIKDESGNPVLSTIATGILSHDLFLNTLDAVFAAERHTRELA